MKLDEISNKFKSPNVMSGPSVNLMPRIIKRNRSDERPSQQTDDDHGLRKLYNYDPIQDFYSSNIHGVESPPTTQTSRQGINEDHGGLSQKSYDFERNQWDREIFSTLDEKSSSKKSHEIGNDDDVNRPKKRKIMRSLNSSILHGMYDDLETKEEREEAERYRKERKKIRDRFKKTKKYDFSHEEDVGGSVKTYILSLASSELKSKQEQEQKTNAIDMNFDENDDGASIKDDSDVEYSKHLRRESERPHVLESLLKKMETYISASDGNNRKDTKVEENDVMSFLRKGYSAPKVSELSYSYTGAKKVKNPGRVYIECNKDFRRSIDVQLKTAFKEGSNSIVLPRFAGDEIGRHLVLDGKNANFERRVPVDDEIKNGKIVRNKNLILAYSVIPQPSVSNKVNVLVSENRRFPSTMRPSAGILPPERLLLSALNPMITRARMPDELDVYHYFPYSTRFLDDQARFNTARGHTSLMTVANKSVRDSFRRVHTSGKSTIHVFRNFIHYRNVLQLTARCVTGSSGALEPTHSKNNNILLRLLRIINKRCGKFGRYYYLISASQEMAGNHILWDIAEPILKYLSNTVEENSRSHRLIRKLAEGMTDHLLTAEGMFANPIGIQARCTITDTAVRTRRKLWKALRYLCWRFRTLLMIAAGIHDDDEIGNNQNHDSMLLDSARQNCVSAKTTQNKTVETIMQKFLYRLEHNRLSSDHDAMLKKIAHSLHKQTPFSILFSLLCIEKEATTNSNTFNEKYADASHECTIDTVSILLTIASLLAELSSKYTRIPGEGSSAATTKDILYMHSQIISYLDLSLLKIIALPPKLSVNFVNVPLAIVTMLKQSYIANSGISSYGNDYRNDEKSRAVCSDEESVDSINQHQQSQLASRMDKRMRLVAEALSQFETALTDNRVLPFPDIRLTIGIAKMAEILPTNAAEILSRSCNSDDCNTRTPFELVRLALEVLDCKGLIVRNRMSMNLSEAVSAEDIIVTFGKCAEIFESCLTHDVDDLTYLSWCVAARVGCLCVASGIVLGDGPALAAPPMYDIDYSERRYRNTNYCHIRAAACKSVRDLLQRHKLYSSILSYHLVVTSLLEWDEAVLLLMSQPRFQKDAFKLVRKLHAAHTICWAIGNASHLDLLRILHLYCTDDVSDQTVLSILATYVERNPGETIPWIRLAAALTKTASRRRSYWWGEDRLWWENHFFLTNSLNIEPMKILRVKKSLLDYEAADVNTITNGVEPKHTVSFFQKKKGVNPKTAKNIISSKFQDSWLWSNDPTDEDEQDLNDDNSDYESFDKFDITLPVRSTQPLKESQLSRLLESLEIADFKKFSHQHQLLCAKAVACSYLFSPYHPFVCYVHNYLMMNCEYSTEGKRDAVKIRKKCSSFRALRWLKDHGISSAQRKEQNSETAVISEQKRDFTNGYQYITM